MKTKTTTETREAKCHAVDWANSRCGHKPPETREALDEILKRAVNKQFARNNSYVLDEFRKEFMQLIQQEKQDLLEIVRLEVIGDDFDTENGHDSVSCAINTVLAEQRMKLAEMKGEKCNENKHQ